MRRRLTISLLVLLAATLAVTTVGSYLLIRRAAVSTAQQELSGQARAIATTVSSGTRTSRLSFRRELKVIANAGAFDEVEVLRLAPDGTITGQLPSGVTLPPRSARALQAGHQVTGHTSSLLIYSAVPTPLTRVTAFLPVVIVTRQAHNPANGLRYFALVAAIALLIAALVAAALARRFTRPLAAAVTATKRIASGDLDATVPIRANEDPEFIQLAESINTMGANLVRAREQERQFILSISHELRTPLTSILGYADAIVDGATEDPNAAARVIGAEAGRLERLVEDLLDLARLDADRFSLDIRTVDCVDLARQVAEGFRLQSDQHGLELRLATDMDRPVWVAADPDRLGQIVANLVENASAFAEHRIDVGAGVVDGVPAIWVVDDGAGIPVDELTRVFERHVTSDRTRSGRKGSGLGLAIVSELAAAMGATVRAESPVYATGGTRMVVRLQGRPGPELGPGPGPGPVTGPGSAYLPETPNPVAPEAWGAVPLPAGVPPATSTSVEGKPRA